MESGKLTSEAEQASGNNIIGLVSVLSPSLHPPCLCLCFSPEVRNAGHPTHYRVCQSALIKTEASNKSVLPPCDGPPSRNTQFDLGSIWCIEGSLLTGCTPFKSYYSMSEVQLNRPSTGISYSTTRSYRTRCRRSQILLVFNPSNGWSSATYSVRCLSYACCSSGTLRTNTAFASSYIPTCRGSGVGR